MRHALYVIINATKVNMSALDNDTIFNISFIFLVKRTTSPRELYLQVQLHLSVRAQVAVALWHLLPASKRGTHERLDTAYPGITLPDLGIEESRA